MALNSRTEVVAALSSGRPQDLLGTAENDWLDFKTAPYDLKTPHGKAELAKDVAAFANRGGGLIVFGVKAVQRSGELYETAEQLTPFDPARISADTYNKVLASEVRPLLSVKLKLFAHPDNQDGTTGSYLVLDVEQLPEDQRHALVRRTIVDGKVTDGWCVPVRNGDQTAFMSADDIYTLINSGVRSRMYPVAPAAPATALVRADPARARQELVEHQGWDDLPVLFWQSTPDIPPSFLLGPDEISGKLEQQEVLRHMGFNFSFEHSRPVPFTDGLLLTEPRRALAVSLDGTVTAAAIATEDMLCWAMGQNYGDPKRLNVLTLTELTYEYLRLVDTQFVPAVDGSWHHRVVGTGFDGLSLAAGSNPAFPGMGAPRPATGGEFNFDWPATGVPETDCFKALARIYSPFGLGGGDNPYIRDEKLEPQLLAAATR
ncbi:helix-turn-helix domain-containing protein [Kitasatospora sp. NBC_01300]|uniref:AlbA family DNA-binding domain-containing protein n=1 Tax=Kitasatospora sp. NBC_01300 TaxID=2903574 RepID=UPI00352C1929|nr:ATP-binding protein [Kitasatospora sp. NBC_01300]